MTTQYILDVYRKTATGVKPNPGTEVKGIMMMPERYPNVTLWAYANDAATCKVELTYSDAAAINGGSAVWVSVHATLDAVGTTAVAYDFGTRVCSAFRVSSLVDNKTATLILMAK
jgi:hypothetical protein